MQCLIDHVVNWHRVGLWKELCTPVSFEAAEEHIRRHEYEKHVQKPVELQIEASHALPPQLPCIYLYELAGTYCRHGCWKQVN